MVVVIEKDEQGNVLHRYYLDGYNKKTLDKCVRRIQKHFDIVILCTGGPGVGKSENIKVMAHYMASQLGTEFTVDNIYFESDELIRGTTECANRTVHVLDESYKDFSSNVSRSSDFQRAVNHLQLIRVKECCIFLILPDFFSLSKTIACFRSNLLIVVYDVDAERGRMSVFEKKLKNDLYHKGKRMGDYNCVAPNYRAVFRKAPGLVDDAEYERRKLEHLSRQALQNEKGSQSGIEKGRIYDELLQNSNLTVEKIAEIYRTTPKYVGWCRGEFHKHQKAQEKPVYDMRSLFSGRKKESSPPETLLEQL